MDGGYLRNTSWDDERGRGVLREIGHENVSWIKLA